MRPRGVEDAALLQKLLLQPKHILEKIAKIS